MKELREHLAIAVLLLVIIIGMPVGKLIEAKACSAWPASCEARK